MPNTGAVSFATAVANFDIGDADWTNPSNALVDDNSYAVSFLDPMEGPFSTAYLQTTNGDFSVIPSGATIDGMLVTVRLKGSVATGANIGSVQFFRNSDSTWYGAVVDDNLTSSVTTTETEYTAGASNELCGVSFTRSDILSANYGVRFYVSSPGDAVDISVDLVTVTVYYTEGGGGGQPSIVRVSGVPGARLGGASFGRGW